MALQHAAHLYNEILKPSTGIAAIEHWTMSKSSSSALKHAYPWGCPTMVLHPKLQDGHKVPKWEPRAKKGQFMEASSLHASSVGLIRKLKTGNIISQFHVVYDDCYENIVSDHTAEPEVLENLIILGGTHRTDYDDTTDIYENLFQVPELVDEFLSLSELCERKSQEDQVQYYDPRDNDPVQNSS